VIPAEIVPGAVSVPPDPLSQAHHLLDKRLARERLKILINRRHETSVVGLLTGRKRATLAVQVELVEVV
jgi:hypothetical protein